MTTAAVVCVSPDMAGVLDQVAGIAAEAALPSAPGAADGLSGRGFLVSGHGIDRYREAAAAGQLTVATEGPAVCAFLFVYGPDDPVDAGDLGSHFIRERFGQR